jgi:PhnB protein
MAVKPIPDDYHRVTPYLVIYGVDKIIDFLIQAFDAKLKHRFERPDGSVMHAELRIGGSAVMMGEPTGDFTPMPGSIYVYSEDCDASYQRALIAGATSVIEPMDMHHAGERYGGVRDMSGNIWWIATHIEDMSTEEMKKRVKEFFKKQRS